MSIEEKILKFFHGFFPEIRIFNGGTIPLEEVGLDPQQDLLEFEKVFDYLRDKNYIERDKLQISITFKGINYYEEKYLKPDYYFLKAIIIILDFFEKLENGEYIDNSIPNSDIIDRLEKEGIIMNNNKFYQFLVALDHKSNLFKNIGPFGIFPDHEISVYGSNKTILTPSARDFLKSWRVNTNLFGKIMNQLKKEILIEEYEELQKCIQQSSWKDACVKMGGILEYLLIIWFEDKSITPSQISSKTKTKKWRDISFHEMIEFYMNNCKNYADEIGTYTDWNLVKTVLKDYRNYVHLLKYEKRVQKGDFLRKTEFDRLYPIFQEIIKKF
ncbi:MAG: hypothetical protein ACFFDH_02420 [Promethearchaeota archaeon]